MCALSTMMATPDPKGILGFLSLTGLCAATFLPDTYYQLDRRDGQVWPYGVIGDSWGSGVSYNKDVLYDDNKDSCLRTKESHGPRMEADITWIGHSSSGLRDAACSGSNLRDIVIGQHQMGKVGNPDVVIMTSGGNNAGFGNIVDVCIYHSDPRHDYGNAYSDDPDRSGECAKALDAALDYINRMAFDLLPTKSTSGTSIGHGKSPDREPQAQKQPRVTQALKRPRPPSMVNQSQLGAFQVEEGAIRQTTAGGCVHSIRDTPATPPSRQPYLLS